MLAIHGLTGHGRRWQTLAERHLPDVAVVAPDLIGHGRSPRSAPWTIEANAAALAAVLADGSSDNSSDGSSDGSGDGSGDGTDRHTDGVVVVGHSFGGAVALQLAAAHPERVAALVLLDPAVGLDGGWMAEIADSMFASPDYTDRAEAREEKRSGSWGDVDDEQLDAELDEHLVELPHGRVGWRISIPAMMSYWSELARPAALPPPDIGVTVVRARRTSPPYVTPGLLDALGRRADFELIDLDCDHMVAQARPAETARIIRDRLDRR
nr:alpha/beta hydrolase [Mycolicibacterium palauense]